MRLLLFILLISAIGLSGQPVELTFTAVNNTSYVRLDSVRVINRTQLTSSTICWPDTSLILNLTPGDQFLYIGFSSGIPLGIHENQKADDDFYVSVSSPELSGNGISVSVHIPAPGTVNLSLWNIHGRLVQISSRQLSKGIHCFPIDPRKDGLYLVTAQWNGLVSSLKVMTAGAAAGKRGILSYAQSTERNHKLKEGTSKDEALESGITDSPLANKAYTFQFASNIPCPGTPVIEYEGQVYNTLQIFSQCWLKENLNAGTMVNGIDYQTDNDIIEKYCYSNNVDSCNKYGGFYQWLEMMQYTIEPVTRGICPPGWHLPSDMEWKILEGVADSEYNIGNPEWDAYNILRGTDAGYHLKTEQGWFNWGNGDDMYGFSLMPAGYRDISGSFTRVVNYGTFWAATESNYGTAWSRGFNHYTYKIYLEVSSKDFGFSVRCIKDN